MTPRWLSCLISLCFLCLLSVLAQGKSESWVQLRTPHFIVLTNSGEKQATRVAGQFERMRAVFQKQLPGARVDDTSPIIVIAVKDKKDFQALEPEAYLAKGQLNLAGLFLRTPDKNYVLLRLDGEGTHPYASVYHEYTHFIMRRAADWLPLWLNEGLAEFYENTEIKDKAVELGEPSEENLMLLSQQRLIPLTTLFAVDQNSPYYHEENKGSIFYAESWALTHYLQITGFQQKKEPLRDYALLVSNKVDPATAATRAFGDLQVLEKNLNKYVGQRMFYHFTFPGTTGIDEAAFKLEPVSLTQADAVRADFLAYNRREKDARTLLNRVLHDDPNNVSARETLGFLAFQQGNLDEAGKWFGEAVKLDSQSYLAHYYFASIAMRTAGQAQRTAEIEASLKAATKLNPSFAPAFDELAILYSSQRKNTEEALALNLRAIELDPLNIQFRMNRASMMLSANRPKDAIAVLQAAMKVASGPGQTDLIRGRLAQIQQFQNDTERWERESREASQSAGTVEETEPVSDAGNAAPKLQPRGPQRTVSGTLRDVKCSYPSTLKLDVLSKTATLHLRAANYYKVEYSTLNYKPEGDLHPCQDMEGMKAKVTYYEGQSAEEGILTAIQLSK